MVNILFISNDRRVGGLISYLQPLLKGAINCTSDFDQGLKDVFDKRPAIVFVQKKIANVSGDVVAQHIKGLLRDNRPKIILLQDDAENSAALNPSYDDTIGFVLPEPEIYKVFYKYLRKFPEIPWIDDAAGDQQPAAAEEKPVAPAQPPPSSAGGAGIKHTLPAGPAPEVSAAHPKKHEGTARFAASRPAGKNAGSLTTEPLPFLSQPVRKSRLRLALLVAGGVLLAVFAFFAFNPFPGFTLPWSGSMLAEYRGGGGKGSGRISHLPAVIVMNPADSAYAVANPGWEQYRGEYLDFRIYREKGEIKVVQGISRVDAGVRNEFLAAFLFDLLRSTTYQVASTVRKNGYIVEKGTASPQVEIIVYRLEKTNHVKGFVISFSDLR